MSTADLVAAIYKVDEPSLWRAIHAELDPREALVLILRFQSEFTLDKVGANLLRLDGGQQVGVSKERVRQIMVRALRKLRHSTKLKKFQPGAGWTPLQLRKLLDVDYHRAQRPGRRVNEGGLYLSDWRAIFNFLEWLGEKG